MTKEESKFTAADELDDGLVYDYEDNENEAELVQLEHLSEDDSVTEKPAASVSEKRGKKRSKSSQNSLKDKKKQKSQDIAEQKSAVSKMAPEMIADFIAGKIRRKHKDLSTIELNDLYINQSKFEEISVNGERTLDNLPEFVAKTFSGMFKKNKKGSMVFIFSMSAIRVCEVSRALRSTEAGCLKLISKNKLEYDRKAVSSGQTNIAASTPGRTKKLLQEKILDYSNFGAIVVDSSYLDVKQSNVWDLEDTVDVLKTITDNCDAKIYLY